METHEDDKPIIKDDYVFPRKKAVIEDADKGSIAHHVIAGTVTWVLSILFGIIIPYIFTPVLSYTAGLFVPKNTLPLAEAGQVNETSVDLNAANYVDNLLSQIASVSVVWVILAFIYIIVLVYQLRIAVISGGLGKATAVAFTIVMPFVTVVLIPIWINALFA